MDCTQVAIKSQDPPGIKPTPASDLFERSLSTISATINPNGPDDAGHRVCLQIPASASQTILTATTAIPAAFRTDTTVSAAVSVTGTTCTPGKAGSSPAVTGNATFGKLYEQMQSLMDKLQQQLSGTSPAAGASTTTKNPMQLVNEAIQQLQQQLADQKRSTKAPGATTPAKGTWLQSSPLTSHIHNISMPTCSSCNCNQKSKNFPISKFF